MNTLPTEAHSTGWACRPHSVSKQGLWADSETGDSTVAVSPKPPMICRPLLRKPELGIKE